MKIFQYVIVTTSYTFDILRAWHDCPGLVNFLGRPLGDSNTCVYDQGNDSAGAIRHDQMVTYTGLSFC